MASIFTRIIAGDIPCYKIAEDDRFFAFLDINPVAAGHTLVIPKMEIDYLFDQPEEILSGLLPFAKHVARAIDKATGCLRTGIVVEGLEVPHSHIHLIPIYHKGQHAALGRGARMEKEQMEEIAAKIRGALI
jgi:histidine triad (HIT) family protein